MRAHRGRWEREKVNLSRSRDFSPIILPFCGAEASDSESNSLSISSDMKKSVWDCNFIDDRTIDRCSVGLIRVG
jgi:hypothetical protein